MNYYFTKKKTVKFFLVVFVSRKADCVNFIFLLLLKYFVVVVVVVIIIIIVAVEVFFEISYRVAFLGNRFLNFFFFFSFFFFFLFVEFWVKGSNSKGDTALVPLFGVVIVIVVLKLAMNRGRN